MLLKQAAQQQAAAAKQQALLKRQQEQQAKKMQQKMSRSSVFPSTSAAGASAQDSTNAISQLILLNQALQQKAVELDKAKAEAENAGAGDRSLDSMSTDDLVEKMAAAPLYAALGREELRKIAAAALAETQKQRDKARKKLEQAIKNFSIVQQSLQLQTLVVMQQNPQLALLNQLTGSNDSSNATQNILELLSQFQMNSK